MKILSTHICLFVIYHGNLNFFHSSSKFWLWLPQECNFRRDTKFLKTLMLFFRLERCVFPGLGFCKELNYMNQNYSFERSCAKLNSSDVLQSRSYLNIVLPDLDKRKQVLLMMHKFSRYICLQVTLGSFSTITLSKLTAVGTQLYKTLYFYESVEIVPFQKKGSSSKL